MIINVCDSNYTILNCAAKLMIFFQTPKFIEQKISDKKAEMCNLSINDSFFGDLILF